jgi:hypothetical protein
MVINTIVNNCNFMLMWQRYTNNELMTSSFTSSMDYHYEKLCPLQAHCFVPRAPKQLIYNYITTILWKYEELIFKNATFKNQRVVL